MFNYLRCYHEGEALNTIVGLALTNKNYNTALARFTEKSIWQSATNNLSSKEWITEIKENHIIKRYNWIM